MQRLSKTARPGARILVEKPSQLIFNGVDDVDIDIEFDGGRWMVLQDGGGRDSPEAPRHLAPLSSSQDTAHQATLPLPHKSTRTARTAPSRRASGAAKCQGLRLEDKDCRGTDHPPGGRMGESCWDLGAIRPAPLQKQWPFFLELEPELKLCWCPTFLFSPPRNADNFHFPC